MDKQPTVVFRNVGQLYFPQIRVECHYSLTSEHRWSSSDWIGIFQTGWSSVKEYHTYTWAAVPEGYTEGTSVDYWAVFQASYLPRPSSVEYQFVYVDKMGRVCARSRPFTFCAPKPLEELETLKEEQGEEDGEEELLLVIPRAQLLQCRLEQSLKKQMALQRALDEAKKEAENEKETCQRARFEWEREREAIKEEITELRDNLRQSCEMMKRLEERHKDAKYSQEIQSTELRKLGAEKTENQQQVQDLKSELKVLADREEQATTELQRLKERMKKMSTQMKHDEEKRKSLQAEIDASAAEVRGLQEQLEASDHAAEGLRKELRDLNIQRSHTHAELHQARLQVAQLTLQLSDQDLALREERATWALEREAYRHAAEVKVQDYLIDKKKLQDLKCELQRKEEWLQEERTERDNVEAELGREKGLLSNAKRELQELKAALRKAQKGREQEQLHKQELVNCIRQLDMKLGIGHKTKSNSTAAKCISPGCSSEKEALASSESPRSFSLEESITSEVSAETLNQSEGDDSSVDAQEEETQLSKPQTGEDKQLILPELVNPVLSELADSPMW